MTSEDAADKSAIGGSGPVLSQENRQEHQQEGQPRHSRKETKVLSQSAMGHHADGSAAGDGQAGEQAQRGQREQHGRPLRDWNGLVALATTALAVIGIGGLFFTAFQLGAMRDQLDEMRKANRLTERALSSADRAWLFPMVANSTALKANQDFEIKITLQNSGRTPGLHTKAKIGLFVQPTSESLHYNFPRSIPAEMITYPGFKFTSTSTIEAKIVTDQLVADVVSGQRTLYALGAIDYMDVNSVLHHTQTCDYYELVTKSMTPCKIEGSNFAD